jgi:crotonobetainyl-CoA:carnitine CoA-transferase CaiB-like acyl-CoA transferase
LSFHHPDDSLRTDTSIVAAAQVHGGMKGPLSGIRVTECASLHCPLPLRLAMAFTARLAAGLGAEVVKLGSIEADPVRSIEPLVGPDSALSLFLDAGKRHAPRINPGETSDILLRMDPAPDVLLCDDEIFERIGEYGRAGIRTVYSMFPKSTREAATAASEFTIAASTGLLDLVGDPDRSPLRMGGHQLAYSCGLSAYSASVAALCRQLRTGSGEVVDVSLADVAVWLNWKNVITASWSPAIRARLGRDAEWQVVRCADGWIALVYLEADWPVLRDFVDDARVFEPRFNDRSERRRDARYLTQIIEAAFMRYTREALKTMALAKRLPLGPVWSPLELEIDRQNISRGFLSRVASGEGPPLLMPRLPVLWNGQSFPLDADGAGATA